MSPAKKEKILLLGSSGSIGTQSLDILKSYPEYFELAGIAANTSLSQIIDTLKVFPELEAIALSGLDKKEIEKGLEEAGITRPVRIFSGPDAVEKMMDAAEYDMVINALVGFAGLKPTLKTIEKGADLALANKESLVVGGELVKEALKDSRTKIYPIDSEHSAIFQCLQNGQRPQKLLITASGGSLRNLSRDELEDVSVEQVLAHPNWSMGSRITTDSATMLNKVFELIEAHYLFDMEMKDIQAVLHPQSIIHSMVQFEDGSLLAQLGPSDMHEAIQLAIFKGERKPLKNAESLDFDQLMTLDLSKLDENRYPLLSLARRITKEKGNAGAIVNAADEQAIQLFLDGKISYLQLEDLVLSALDNVPHIDHPDYEELKKSDQEARNYVSEQAVFLNSSIIS